MAVGLTEYPNQFKRQYNLPLDKSSKYATLAEAQVYAKTNPSAYNLQIIGVDENNTLYVLVPSTVTGENYTLMPLSAIATSDSNTNVIGTWSVNTNAAGPYPYDNIDMNRLLDLEIHMPITISHFELFDKIDSITWAYYNELRSSILVTDEMLELLKNNQLIGSVYNLAQDGITKIYDIAIELITTIDDTNLVGGIIKLNQ